MTKRSLRRERVSFSPANLLQRRIQALLVFLLATVLLLMVPVGWAGAPRRSVPAVSPGFPASSTAVVMEASPQLTVTAEVPTAWTFPSDMLPRVMPTPHVTPVVMPSPTAQPTPPVSATLALLRSKPEPLRLIIPALSLNAPVVAIGLDQRTGELALQSDVTVVQWYRLGPAPGQPGTALLAGHLDSATGQRGVFAGLSAARPGMAVWVDLTGGQRLAFRVTRIYTISALQLFASGVYTTAGPPRLLLVTCAGYWDTRQQRYTENLIVEAELAPPA